MTCQHCNTLTDCTPPALERGDRVVHQDEGPAIVYTVSPRLVIITVSGYELAVNPCEVELA